LLSLFIITAPFHFVQQLIPAPKIQSTRQKNGSGALPAIPGEQGEISPVSALLLQAVFSSSINLHHRYS
jgi:hypothetical protein